MDDPRSQPPSSDDNPFNVVPIPINVTRPAHQRIVQLWQWFYVTGQRTVETGTPPGGVMLAVFNQLALMATEHPGLVRAYIDTVAEMSPAALGGAALGAAELRDTLQEALGLDADGAPRKDTEDAAAASDDAAA